jgi:predicted MFS family arabinose efflux permease
MITKTINLYKNAFSGLTNKMWLLSIIMLINRCGTMVLVFMTLYCMKNGFTLKQGGIVVGLYGIGSLIGALVGGKISDQFGFYYTQFCALFFGGVMFIVLGFMKSYEAICIVTFFLAMINESFRPANASAIAHYSTPETRTQSFSLVRLSINLGFTFGSAIGGFLASKSYYLLFWVDGCTNILASFFLLLLLPKVTKVQQHKPEVKKEITQKINSPYTDKRFLYFLFFQILFALCFFQLFTTIPIFFKKNLNISEFNFGVIMAASGFLIFAVEMILIFSLEGKKHYLVFITRGTILMALSFLILNIPHVNGILIATIAIIVITIGEMLSMPFMNSYYIGRSSQTTRGQYAGMYTMAWSVAQVIGSMAGSAFADEFGFANLWYLVAVISTISAAGYFWLYKMKER